LKLRRHKTHVFTDILALTHQVSFTDLILNQKIEKYWS